MLLVAGGGCAAAAQSAARIAGVTKVLVADAPQYKDELAESLAAAERNLISHVAGKDMGLVKETRSPIHARSVNAGPTDLSV